MGLWTYEDYVRLPRDGKRHEIIRGIHYNHPSPATKHQLISSNIAGIMYVFVKENKLGFWFNAPYDVVLDKYNVVQPDHVFVSKENEKVITEKNIKGVPDLIVEITSPNDPDYDKKTKFKLYERFKVPHYWIFDSEEDKIYEYVLDKRKGKYKLRKVWEKGEIFNPALFPKLKVKVNDFFS